MDLRKLKIALVVGGTSTERNVSKSSGQSIYKALLSLGCNPIVVDPAYGINQPKDKSSFFAHDDTLEISNLNYVRVVNSKLFDNVDIAFLALHGKWGEDGTIQSLLELRGVKYTGSKVLASALAMDKIMSKILFEEFIDGQEVTVAVLDNQPLPVLEIKPKHNVYDYECKYTSGMSEYEVPAKIPEEVVKQIQDQALAAHISLGCEVYSRADFRLSNELKPYCLEVNTLPGMTSTSLVPKMAKAVGISFEELIEKIITLSL